ncbi:hypothetical protein [Streptomyces sp. IBSBF 2435]|uniref:hypothetical protein n=1 Tax=Streptomyces sp. IBSBF 2435 TaxID=2903531 RepID=UPI002FDC30F4
MTGGTPTGPPPPGRAAPVAVAAADVAVASREAMPRSNANWSAVSGTSAQAPESGRIVK